MKVVIAERMKQIATEIFAAAGSKQDEARQVAEHLVEASLVGVDSHGIIRIPEYVGKILGKSHSSGRGFRIVPNAPVKILKDSGAMVMLDGGWGFGQIVAKKAMELAIGRARSFNISIVTGCNCDHIGRLGSYALMAVEGGMIGMVFAKGPAVMSPPGVKGRLIGNNPMSFAIPAGNERPIMLDYAMSVVAAGKLTVAIDKGEAVPPGWVLDSGGNPTTDPSAFLRGGSLVPFASYKGYAMSVVVEALAGVLAGAGVLGEYAGNNSFTVGAINVDAFVPLREFKHQIDRLINAIRAAPRVREDAEVLIPGEPEFRTREKRLSEGIPIPDATWYGIVEAGKDVGISI